MNDITSILIRVNNGDRKAVEELLSLVYSHLRQIASGKLAREDPGNSFHSIDLVNEAYLRLMGERNSAQEWNNRSHFLGAAAEAMRRILVEHARKKKSQKRGGHLTRKGLDKSFVASHDKLDELLSIHEVLDELEGHDEQAARLVKLRYFVGMKHKEVAAAMNITRGSADHLWQTARNWLYRRLS